jgi:hypothetical protein
VDSWRDASWQASVVHLDALRRHTMKVVAAVLLVSALVAVGYSSPAGAASASTWYWSPAACKAELQNHGVAISDGRTFNVAKAYCVGLHNHCWLNDRLRRYKVFDTVMRSYDGVVREMLLTVTGHNTWSGSHMRIIEQRMSLARFNGTYGPAAWTVATNENAAGCFDVHP